MKHRSGLMIINPKELKLYKSGANVATNKVLLWAAKNSTHDVGGGRRKRATNVTSWRDKNMNKTPFAGKRNLWGQEFTSLKDHRLGGATACGLASFSLPSSI